jgi:hypothetical protein
VAQGLAERLPRAAHVRGNLFRRMIVSGGQALTPDEAAEATAQLWLRYRLAAMVADGYAGAGFTAVLQDVVLGPDLPRSSTWSPPGEPAARPGARLTESFTAAAEVRLR